MIVVADREKLLDHIDACLAVGVMPNSFDEAFLDFCIESKDDTVCEIGLAFAGYSSAINREFDLMRKADWDTLQRLRLVLQSGLELQPTVHHHAHLSQLAAVVVLVASAAAFTVLYLRGWTWTTAAAWVGVPAMFATGGVVIWREYVTKKPPPPDPRRQWPFLSTTQLIRTRKQVAHFYRRTWPHTWRASSSPPLAAATMHSSGLATVGICLLVVVFFTILLVGLWSLCLWPLILLYACLPITTTGYTVGDPEEDWHDGLAPTLNR